MSAHSSLPDIGIGSHVRTIMGGRGLYVITDIGPARDPSLARRVEAAINGGARIVQYRNKASQEAYPLVERIAEARELAVLCREKAACFVVNDDVELARACDADGVHLGRDEDWQSDQALTTEMGDRSLLYGASCYNSLERAAERHAKGAHYLAFGRFFSSSTKPSAVETSVSLLQEARVRFDCPLVAIGGITAANATPLIEAGADWLAVVGSVFGQDSLEGVHDAAAELLALFD
ncbi:thiamine phosphate synthase [Allohahella marinimesophila]|uniref:Thiamine-phosphate synthase n=1 Tax=Allohahella marinimesophila TaxID=1054972 RepID=A0ABP7P5C2_9GAMM